MGIPAKIKQRAHRERQKDGKRVLRVEVAEVPLIESLIATGFLQSDQQDSAGAVEASLERVIEVWTISVTGNGTRP